MLLNTFINLHVYLIFIRIWFLTSWARPTNVTLVKRLGYCNSFLLASIMLINPCFDVGPYGLYLQMPLFGQK